MPLAKTDVSNDWHASPSCPMTPLSMHLHWCVRGEGTFLFWIRMHMTEARYLPGGSDGKESAWNAGDLGLIPGSGRSPGEGNSYPLQYSCLENPTDRGAWRATVQGVAKSQTRPTLSLYVVSHDNMYFSGISLFLSDLFHLAAPDLSCSLQDLGSLLWLAGSLAAACRI